MELFATSLIFSIFVSLVFILICVIPNKDRHLKILNWAIFFILTGLYIKTISYWIIHKNNNCMNQSNIVFLCLIISCVVLSNMIFSFYIFSYLPGKGVFTALMWGLFSLSVVLLTILAFNCFVPYFITINKSEYILTKYFNAISIITTLLYISNVTLVILSADYFKKSQVTCFIIYLSFIVFDVFTSIIKLEFLCGLGSVFSTLAFYLIIYIKGDFERLKQKAIDIENESELMTDRATQFMQMLENLSGCAAWFVFFDENGKEKEISWGKSLRTLLGYSEGMIPKTVESWTDMIFSEDKEKSFAACKIAMKTGILNQKYRMVCADGTVDWFQAQGKVEYYENGNPKLFFGTILKITQEVLNEKDINERLSTYLDGVEGGLRICRYDDSFTTLFVSSELCKIFGYSNEEFLSIINKDICGLIHPDDLREVYFLSRNELRTKGNLKVKYRVHCKDESWKWVNEYSKIVINSQGEKLVYSLIQDINEQELLTRKFQNERNEYRNALLKNSRVRLNVDLTNGNVHEEWYDEKNIPFFKTIGMELPVPYDTVLDFFEKTGTVVLDEESWEGYKRDKLLQKYESGVTQVEYCIYTKFTDTYDLSRCLLYKNPDDGHIYTTIILYDITSQKKNEIEQQNKLEQALKSAKEANKAKTVFLNNMSHDIRTPMNAIIGFTNLAKENLKNEEKLEDYLNKIQTSSDHLLSLINEVLDMSRIESGKIKLDKQKISLSALINDIQNIIQVDAISGNINLKIDSSNISDDLVLCDNMRLKRIILNCLTNSIKYTKSGGNVSLSVIQKEKTADNFAEYFFKVEDTGIGMTQEFASHIFEPFSREDDPEVSKIQGTGLGMPIAKKLVDLMNGDIKVETEKGKGTAFLITLKLPLAEKTSDTDVKTENMISLDNYRILLVEDNELNREIAEEILTSKGAVVETAKDGSEAVSIMSNLKEQKYDLILMDIMMPVLNGYEASRQIRALENKNVSSVPIIAMTANAFEEDKKLALEAGMNAHIAKPINVDTLLSTISEYL